METTFEVGQKPFTRPKGRRGLAIETKEISGHQEHLHASRDGLCQKVMIPVSKVSSVGLRPVIDVAAVPEVYTL